MTCSRCSSPLLNQLQFDRGLCAICLTGSSLSALVALASSMAAEGARRGVLMERVARLAERYPVASPIQPPICFAPACPCGRTGCEGTHYRSDFEGLPKTWPSDTAWKADVFGDGEIQ